MSCCFLWRGGSYIYFASAAEWLLKYDHAAADDVDEADDDDRFYWSLNLLKKRKVLFFICSIGDMKAQRANTVKVSSSVNVREQNSTL